MRQYSEKLHRDLPQTRLRGYVQLNSGTDANGRNTVEPAPIHYLGPLIEARRGRPVRIKFVNELPTGNAGKLFLPVDTTVPGAGAGPLGGDKTYPQNRASLHLHGGLTPWISGGSQYQWVTPAASALPTAPAPASPTSPTCGSTPRAGRSTRDARSHQRPRSGRHDAVLPQRPERPLPLPARRHLRAHAPQRVRGRGRAVLHRRRSGRRARRRQRGGAGVESGARCAGRGRYRAGRRAAAHHRGQDLRPRPRAAHGAGPDLGRGSLGRAGGSVVPARLHAEPERPVRQRATSTRRAAGTTSPGTGRATTAR